MRRLCRQMTCQMTTLATSNGMRPKSVMASANARDAHLLM